MWLFRLEYLADISWGMNAVSPSTRKTISSGLSIIKIWASSKNSNYGKLVAATMNLNHSIPIHNDFTVVMLTDVTF